MTFEEMLLNFRIRGSGIKMGLTFRQNLVENGSTFEVSAARPYPNHT